MFTSTICALFCFVIATNGQTLMPPNQGMPPAQGMPTDPGMPTNQGIPMMPTNQGMPMMPTNQGMPMMPSIPGMADLIGLLGMTPTPSQPIDPMAMNNNMMPNLLNMFPASGAPRPNNNQNFLQKYLPYRSIFGDGAMRALMADQLSQQMGGSIMSKYLISELTDAPDNWLMMSTLMNRQGRQQQGPPQIPGNPAGGAV